MKLIIAGSRDINISIKTLCDIIDYFSIKNINEIVCGMAKGVDLSGKYWAENNNINVKEFSADWELYNGRAGPIRNSKMATYADALLLIWDGKSSGSADMKRKMEKAGKPVYEVILRGPKLKEKNP